MPWESSTEGPAFRQQQFWRDRIPTPNGSVVTVSGPALTLMPLASAVEALKVDFWLTPRVYLENKVYFTLAGFSTKTSWSELRKRRRRLGKPGL